jgi:hypothetical protein
MLLPLCCHWYVGGGLPVATTVNVTAPPAPTVWETGCVVSDGAAETGITVKLAELPTEPAEFETVTVYNPASVD